MLSINEVALATKGKIINGKESEVPKNYGIDSRLIEKGDFFVPLLGENVDAHIHILDCVKKGAMGFFINADFADFNKVIKEAKLQNSDICIIEVRDTKEALFNAGKYNRSKHIDIPVVAVTGSVGKTSTREMIASILKQEKDVLVTEKNYNSYIGLPIMLLKINKQELCVLEVGIDTVGEMENLSEALIPDVVVITMIGTAHIGVIGSKQKIFEEKMKLANNIKGVKTLIVNGSDEYLTKLQDNDNFSVTKFDNNKAKVKVLRQEENVIDFETLIYDNAEIIKINDIGAHNISNALCGIKVAEIFNIKSENIKKGIEEYRNFKKRLEKKIIGDGIVIIDDTYNASIDSMISGLVTVNGIKGNRKIAILGDMFELGEYSKELHEKVGDSFKNLNYDLLYTLGDESKNIAHGAKKYLRSDCVRSFDDKQELIRVLKKVIQPKDVVYFKASNAMNFPEIVESLEREFKNK